LLVSLAQEQWHRGWLARRLVHASLAWCVVLCRAFPVSTARLAKGGGAACWWRGVGHQDAVAVTRSTEAVVHHTLQRAPWTTLPRERGIAAAGGDARLHLAILEAGPSWQACVVPHLHPGLLPGRTHWEQGCSGPVRHLLSSLSPPYVVQSVTLNKKINFAPLLRLDPRICCL
jgi:hypothetical protein